MRLLSLYIFILLFAFVSCMGKTDHSKQVKQETYLGDSVDQAIFNSIREITGMKSISGMTNGERVIELGKIFLQTPYVAHTLEGNESEKLVVNLRELDCTTYLENVVAFSNISKKPEYNEQDFLHELKEVRYRNGKITNYNSRLHYFSDWIYENQKKGLVKNITSEIGGEEYEKEINFMSNHVDSYSALKADSSLVKSIEVIENKINQRKLYYIPEDKIQELESKIENGDLIAITTKIKGLDISHVGIAIHVNDRLHLMHASSLAKKVVISDIPLDEILMESKLQSGIMVARVVK